MEQVSNNKSTNISALLLCQNLGELPSWDEIVESAQSVHPDFAQSLMASSQHQKSETEEICLTSAGHDQITCVFRKEQVPDSLIEQALNMPRVSKEMANTINQHDSYIYLSLGEIDFSHSTVLQATLSLTLFAASLAQVTQCPLVYWPASKGLLYGDTVIESAKRIDEGQLPLELWINLLPAQINDHLDNQTLQTLTTEGLLPLTGYEVEFAPSTLSQKHLAIHTLAVATAILLDGTDTLVDGDIIGQEDESIRLRIRQEGNRTGIPVIELSQEHM